MAYNPVCPAKANLANRPRIPGGLRRAPQTMIDDILTMIPGPTPVHPRVLGGLARPTVSHVAPAFVETYRACLTDVKAIGRTASASPFVVAGAGTLAMEMALVNLLSPGERLLIVSQGFFGDRYAQVAEAFGIPFEHLQSDWGTAVAPERLERALGDQAFAAVAMTHVDTSTGTAAPVEDYAEVLRGHESLSILDGVCATAGMDERVDDWGLDVLFTGAQKALGAPPGVAILLVSARAMARRRALDRVPAYYADLLRWEPIMQDPGKYFSTPAVNEVVALHQATQLVLEEGLDARFARHARLARAARAGFAAVGLEPFTARDRLADTLSVLRYPAGVEDAAFRGALARRGVVVAGALGEIAGRAVRVGHMGNIGSGEVCRLLQAAEESLRELGQAIEPGSALAAAGPHLA